MKHIQHYSHYSPEQYNEWLRGGPPVQRYDGPAPNCKQCGGHGWYYLRTGTDAAVRYCECVTHGATGLAQMGVPERHRGCTLDNYEPIGPQQADAHRAARQFCDAYPGGYSDDKNGLLLQGPPGTGKTHIAVAILDRIHEGIFIAVPDLLERMKREMDDNAPKRARAEAEGARLLILDDIGLERGTDWEKDQIVGILHHRYVSRKPTVITTNLKAGKSLAERVTPRIESRLHEMCRIVTVPGNDYRKREAS